MLINLCLELNHRSYTSSAVALTIELLADFLYLLITIYNILSIIYCGLSVYCCTNILHWVL